MDGVEIAIAIGAILGMAILLDPDPETMNLTKWAAVIALISMSLTILVTMAVA